MKANHLFGIAVLTVGISLGGCGGGVSLRYSDSGVDKVELGTGAPALAVVDMIDGREVNTAPLVNKELNKDLAALRQAVRTHLKLARLVASEKQVLPAPQTIEQVQTILNEARQRGAGAMLFLRLNLANFHGSPAGFVAVTNFGTILAPVGGIGLLPIVVVNSIPVNEEGAHVWVEAIIVDTKTHVILGRFEGREDYDDTVAGWSHNPPDELPDAIKKAVGKALAGMAAEVRAGFPNRTKKPELNVILAPATGLQLHPALGTAHAD